jgi:hypothetical protein
MTTMQIIDPPKTQPDRKPQPDPLPECMREYFMKRRQTLIMELGEIEDLLRLERSIVPRRKRGG